MANIKTITKNRKVFRDIAQHWWHQKWYFFRLGMLHICLFDSWEDKKPKLIQLLDLMTISFKTFMKKLLEDYAYVNFILRLIIFYWKGW